MEQPCVDCPFNASGPGLRLRRSLRPGRWRSILAGLLQGEWFACHKTTRDDDDESHASAGARYCAGAIAYEDKHQVSSNYRRVCERLDWRRDRLTNNT
jgi:hypothetical protein